MQGKIVRAEVCRAAFDYCCVALARGVLTRDGNGWRYGRRRFSNETVKRLIDEGIGYRDGLVIRPKGGIQACGR
jgi:hypothetical protein